MDKIGIYLVFLTLSNLQKTFAQPSKVEMVIRHSSGDLFLTGGSNCRTKTCPDFSGDASKIAAYQESLNFDRACVCHCGQNLPVFREDFGTCVDDIRECTLAPFVNGAISEKVPYVFLPLKGQIVHPSRNVLLTNIAMPVCAISRASYSSERGWLDLKNPADGDIPFRLFRDEGRTFVQWTGETGLRNRLAGKLVLVHLLCRELTQRLAPDGDVFTPCVSFRVAGSSSKRPYNISEVTFSVDADRNTHSLYVSEYVIVGVSLIFVGIVYILSVTIYAHFKKQKSFENPSRSCLRNVEEGVVKSNPLLDIEKKYAEDDQTYSEGTSSDTDVVSRLGEVCHKVNALVHPHDELNDLFLSYQDSSSSSSLEKHPEENVSIVETVEGRDELLAETFQDITGITKKKLYFNPSYFEPQLLLAPPPAAIEFLTKIREVISVAKQKLNTKRFVPTLFRIPEEEYGKWSDPIYDPVLGSGKRSAISLKRENSRRNSCAGCPGCQPRDSKSFTGKLPQLRALAACRNCTSSSETKRKSIRKWLEDVPSSDAEGKIREEESKPTLTSEWYRENVIYETDSLERRPNIDEETLNFNTGLPMSEEMTMGNAVLSCSSNIEDETEKRDDEYSMVSEVYVNNGYDYNSTSTSPNESVNTTLEKPVKKESLTIRVEDCPDNYIQVENLDFEPDTFDRKSSKKYASFKADPEKSDQILLRTTGSFNSRNPLDVTGTSFTSLREIYEYRTKFGQKRSHSNSNFSIPPDIIPFPHRTGEPVYDSVTSKEPETNSKEFIENDKGKNDQIVFQTAVVLPLKVLEPIIHLQDSDAVGATTTIIKVENGPQKIEDSGYLSSDSGKEKRKSNSEGSDSDESFGDGHSESGAESIETHSVFFGRYTKPIYLAAETTADRNYELCLRFIGAEDETSQDEEPDDTAS